MIQIKDLVYTVECENAQGDNLEKIDVIKGMNLEIREGEFLAILGHNGSGKSTLAQHLNALLAPTKGSVIVDGVDTSDKKTVWDVRQNVAMVFQNPDNQMVAATIEEEVGFGPENLCLSPKEIHERADRCLQLLEMEHEKTRSTNRLSGGQKQRVVIASALAMHSKYMILDEPTAMLNPKGREEVIEILHNLNQTQEITMILVTHYMEEVIHADRIIVMNQGEIVMEGTPREIFERVEELEQYHLDVPAATRIGYELKKKGLPISGAILDRKELVEELCRLNLKI